MPVVASSRMNIILPQELYEEIREVSFMKRIPMSTLVQRAVEEYLKSPGSKIYENREVQNIARDNLSNTSQAAPTTTREVQDNNKEDKDSTIPVDPENPHGYDDGQEVTSNES